MEAKKYNQVTPEILEQFKAIVPGKVYAGEEINSDYFHDEMPIYGKGIPEVVIEATTTEDIAAIVKVCYENSIPVIPRGFLPRCSPTHFSKAVSSSSGS